jgi:hypothetical protein
MKRTFAIALGAVTVAVAIPLLMSLYESSRFSWPRETFDPNRWRQTPSEERYRQVNDLLSKHKLVGRTVGDVELLLGKPDNRAADGRYVSYVLKSGEKDRFTFNFLYLLRIWVDTRGTVSAVNVTSD